MSLFVDKQYHKKTLIVAGFEQHSFQDSVIDYQHPPSEVELCYKMRCLVRNMDNEEHLKTAQRVDVMGFTALFPGYIAL